MIQNIKRSRSENVKGLNIFKIVYCIENGFIIRNGKDPRFYD